MICVIKHKNGKYLKGAMGRKKYPYASENISNVKFYLTSEIKDARLIEDPNINNIIKYGLEVIPVRIKNTEIEQAYRILEHG